MSKQDTAKDSVPLTNLVASAILDPMKPRVHLLAVLLCLTGADLPVSAQVATYDVVAGFSALTNPTGAWSYGETSNGSSSFNLLNQQEANAWSGGCVIWRDTSICAPRVALIDSSDTIILNWGYWGPTLHLGKWMNDDAIPVLRFTAPVTGSYSLHLVARCSSQGDSLSLRINGQTSAALPFHGSLYLELNNVFNLQAGDTLDIVGSNFNDSLSYRMNGVYLNGAIHLDSSPGLPPITFIPPGGLFTNQLQVILQNNTEAGIIRYTVDGTEPDANSTAYSAPALLTAATELRASIFNGSAPATATHSTSYQRVYALDDGIPAAWREQYFGQGYLTDPQVAAEADPDGDQVDNRHEYWAETSPVDAGSVRFIDWLARDFSTNQNPAGAWSYGTFEGPYSSATVFHAYPVCKNGVWADWMYSSVLGNDVAATGFRIDRDSTSESLRMVAPPANLATLPIRRAAVRYVATHQGNHRIVLPTQQPLTGPYAPYSGPFKLGINGQVIYTVDLADANSTLAGTFDRHLNAGDTVDFLVEGALGGGPNGNSYLLRASVEALDVAPPAPTLSIQPGGGLFTNSVQVVITTSSASGVIRYTTDSSAPTVLSAAYVEPIVLTDSTTIKAQLFIEGVPVTAVIHADFIRYQPPPDIEFVPPGGIFNGTISVSMINHVGAGIVRYTLDGSAPTPASTPFGSPLSISNTVTITAGVFLNQFPVSSLFPQTYERSYVTPDDGIPTEWREQYFGSNFATNPLAAADADGDADGSTNLQEYQAGTDPTDPLSGFRASIRAVPAIIFPTVLGQTYRVLRMSEPTGPATLLTTIVATGIQASFVDDNPPDNSFYLVELVTEVSP